jgi:hypothetical protein
MSIKDKYDASTKKQTQNLAFDVSRTPTCATLAHCGVLVSYEMRCDVVDNAISEHLSMLRCVCHGCFTPSSDISPLIASRPPAILALWLPHALRRYQLIVCLTPSGDISLIVCLTPSGDISSLVASRPPAILAL